MREYWRMGRVFVPEVLLGKWTDSNRDAGEAGKKLSAQLKKTYESLTFAFLNAIQKKHGPVESAEKNRPESTEN